MRKTLASILVAVLAMVCLGLAQAKAIGDDVDPSDPGCVPAAAWTEVIEHEAVTHTEEVIDVPGTPAVAEVWANFSPNDNKGPFDGPPSYPTDPRGTWHDKGHLPPGHAGPDGVYQRGNGNGDWFYRQAGKPAVDDTYKTIVIVDVEAYTENIEHPEVICEQPPVEPNVINPSYEIKVDCAKPLIEWIIVEPSDRYSFEVYETGPYNYEIKFVTGGDFVFFETGDTEFIAEIALPVFECDEPSVETDCNEKRCVKIETYDDGRKVKTVKRYDNVVEEGF